MRQLVLLLFLLVAYVAVYAQPFGVDTGYSTKNWPVHMKVNPNGQTIWISLGDSASTSKYYFNSFEQGVGHLSQGIIAPKEYTTGLVAFDWQDKLVWLEVEQNTDTLFMRWLSCDVNGSLLQSRKSSMTLGGYKTVLSGRFLNGRFLLVLTQWTVPGGIQNLSLLEFDTLGNLLETHPLPGISNITLINPNIRTNNQVNWLSDSSWTIQTVRYDTLAGGQVVMKQSVTAFDYSGNLRWSVDEYPYGVSTWEDESQVYIWELPPRLRAYTRTASGLQLRWEKTKTDLGLSNHQMSYPLFSVDDNGITMVGNDTSFHMGIMRLDFQGNVIWHRKHALWHAAQLPPQFPQSSYENWARQIHRNAAGHYWLFGVQQETIHFISYDHIGLWYAYLDSNGCVNQQCTPLSIEETNSNGAAELHVYPNPANDLLYVNFQISQSLKSTELHLSDMQGRIRFQNKAVEPEVQYILPVHALEAGVYVLQLVQDGRLVAFEKVVVGR